MPGPVVNMVPIFPTAIEIFVVFIRGWNRQIYCPFVLFEMTRPAQIVPLLEGSPKEIPFFHVGQATVDNIQSLMVVRARYSCQNRFHPDDCCCWHVCLNLFS